MTTQYICCGVSWPTDTCGKCSRYIRPSGDDRFIERMTAAVLAALEPQARLPRTTRRSLSDRLTAALELDRADRAEGLELLHHVLLGDRDDTELVRDAEAWLARVA